MSDKQEQLTMQFVSQDGEQVDVMVRYPEGKGMYAIQALKDAGTEHARMRAIYALRDDPSVGAMLVEYQIDFSDPQVRKALDEFGLGLD